MRKNVIRSVATLTAGAVLSACSAGLGSHALPSGVDASTSAASRTLPHAVEYSKGITHNSFPAFIAKGADGAMWFTETNTNGIGRISRWGHVTEYRTGLSEQAGPTGIALGPDGNMWFAEQGSNGYSRGAIGRITPAGRITEFSKGLDKLDQPFAMTLGPDGNLWFTIAEHTLTSSGLIGKLVGKIGRITTAGVITVFTKGITASSAPQMIAKGPDGNLWFTEVGLVNGIVGRITPQGHITEFKHGITPITTLWGIPAGPDGNVWFTEHTLPPPLNKKQHSIIARITPAGVITEFSKGISPTAGPRSIVTGPDGNLWFADYYDGSYGKITTKGVISTYINGIDQLTGPPGPYDIEPGPNKTLWMTELVANRIARIRVL